MQSINESVVDRQSIWGFLAKVFVWTFAAAIIIATAYRLLHGVDFVDEALYVVMPYRFALGAHPYVDELLFHQTASFIVYPFMKAFVIVTGGTTGIMMFMRFLLLSFMSAVGWTVWRATKESLGRMPAITLALMCPAFIYFNLPGLSYNTLGLGFFTAGSFLGLIALSEKKKGYCLAAGIAHGLAVMSYPTLVGAVAVYACLLIYALKERGSIIRYLAGGSVVLVVYGLIVLAAGPANYWASYQLAGATGIFGGGLSKIINLFKAFIYNYQGKLPVLVLLATIWLFRNRKPWVAGILMAVFPVIALSFIGYPDKLQSLGYVTYLAFTAPVFYAFMVKRQEASQIFWLVWLPGIIAGLFSAYTSTMGYYAAAIGFFQASVAAVALLWLVLRKTIGDDRRLKEVLRMAVVIIPVVILVACQYNNPYGDDAMVVMTSRFSSGPYLGLYTSPVKKGYLDSIASDVKRVGSGAKSILFFDNLPAGYLLTDIKPLTDRAWITSYYENLDRGTTTRYYKKRGSYPDLIVKMNMVYYGAGFQEKLIYKRSDPLNALTESKLYKAVVRKSSYTIYRKKQ